MEAITQKNVSHKIYRLLNNELKMPPQEFAKLKWNACNWKMKSLQ